MRYGNERSIIWITVSLVAVALASALWRLLVPIGL